MILVRAKADSDRHFLVDARYAGIGTICRCIARLPGVEFTVPLKSPWKYFVWSGENNHCIAAFTFRGRTYEVDDDCPFTGDVSVRSEDAPVVDILVVQEHVERTALSPLRMRIEALLSPQFRRAMRHQQGAAGNSRPASQ
jgi:hypothetical protein